MIDNGGPAFPGVDYVSQHNKKNPEGMSLRDYFAAKAMHAFLTTANDFPDEHWPMYLSLDAYRLADAMLEARTHGVQK